MQRNPNGLKFDAEVEHGVGWLTWKSIFKICIEDKFRVYVANKWILFPSHRWRTFSSPFLYLSLSPSMQQRHRKMFPFYTQHQRHQQHKHKLSKCNNKPLFCVFFFHPSLPHLPRLLPSVHVHDFRRCILPKLLFGLLFASFYYKSTFICVFCRVASRGHLPLTLAY